MEYTSDTVAALQTLRDAGWVVCAFTPEELEGVDASHVEDRLVELGWDVIDSLKGN